MPTKALNESISLLLLFWMNMFSINFFYFESILQLWHTTSQVSNSICPPLVFAVNNDVRVQRSVGVPAGCPPCGCDSPAAGEDSGSSSSPAACHGSAWPGGAEDQSSGRRHGSSSRGPTPPFDEPPETTTEAHTHTFFFSTQVRRWVSQLPLKFLQP